MEVYQNQYILECLGPAVICKPLTISTCPLLRCLGALISATGKIQYLGFIGVLYSLSSIFKQKSPHLNYSFFLKFKTH